MHTLHCALEAVNRSRAVRGEMFRQNGHIAMMFSHPSSHLHWRASFNAHAQHMDFTQHVSSSWVLAHASLGQKVFAQMKHASSSSPPESCRRDGMATSTTKEVGFLRMRGMLCRLIFFEDYYRDVGVCLGCSSVVTMGPIEIKAARLATQLQDMLRDINAEPFATPARVCTMTFTAKTSLASVCRSSVMVATSLVDGNGPLGFSKKRMRDAGFFNQTTICHGSKSVKVFKNGRIHVTGCTSPAQFLEVAAAVCCLLDLCGDDTGTHITDFDVHMININFAAGRNLLLQDLRDSCLARGHTAMYDADVYPGLKVKLGVGASKVTALVFKSGKIIMTGKGPAHLAAAHRHIAEVLGAKKNVVT